MSLWIIPVVIMMMGIVPYVTPAFAQVEIINVNNTGACFLNYTAGYEMFENCGLHDDFLDFALSPWEWVTGGHFSSLIVSVLILFTYMKYKKIVYPMLTGVVFLPFSFFLFPATFITWALLMTGVGIAFLIWYIFIKQTKEY